MRRLIMALILSMFSCYANSKEYDLSLYWSASLQDEGFPVSSFINGLRLKTSFEKEFEAIDSVASFYADVQVQHDSVYDWSSAYSEASSDRYRDEFIINDLYIKYEHKNLKSYLGYQKLTWGQADNLQIIDYINPVDYKNFVLPTLDDYKISVPMMRTEISIDTFLLELVWMPYFQSSIIPPTGSNFYYPILSDLVEEEKYRSNQWAVHVKDDILDTNVDLYFFKGRNDFPVLTLENHFCDQTKFFEEKAWGFSFSKEIFNVVFRGDASLVKDRTYNLFYGFPAVSDYINWLVGIDYLKQNWLFSTQYSYSKIKEYQDAYIDPENNKLLTVSATGNLVDGLFEVNFFNSFLSMDGHSGNLFQANVSYFANKNWKMKFGVDLLDGDSPNVFGLFKNEDRIYYDLTYSY